MNRLEQLQEDTKIAVTFIAYCIYLVSSVAIFFASLSGMVGVLIGFMMFFTSSVGIIICASILYQHRERLYILQGILPKKIRRKLKKWKRKMDGDDYFG